MTLRLIRFPVVVLAVSAIFLTGCGTIANGHSSEPGSDWPSDPVKRAEAALTSLIPPDSTSVRGGAEAGGKLDIGARGNGVMDYPNLDAKQRYDRYLANARRNGWHVVKTYKPSFDPNGRAEQRGFDLELAGVEADFTVWTSHGKHYDHVLITVN